MARMGCGRQIGSSMYPTKAASAIVLWLGLGILASAGVTVAQTGADSRSTATAGHPAPRAPSPRPSPILQEFERTGDDDADAATVRSRYLERVWPEEWQCYMAESHPLAKKAIFGNAFGLMNIINSGYDLPDTALQPHCAKRRTPAPVRGALRLFKDRLAAGLRQVLHDAIHAPGAGAVVAAATDNTPTVELSADALLRIREDIAAPLVGPALGEEAGRAFLTAPPMTQAQMLCLTALAVTESRRWPNVFMLGMSEMGNGMSMYFTLQQTYGENDPDVMDWQKYSDERKGEAVRRSYVDIWRRALRAANREITIAELAAAWREQMPSDPRDMVDTVFGKPMVERYRNARAGHAEPGYSATEIADAAFIMRGVLANLPTVLH